MSGSQRGAFSNDEVQCRTKTTGRGRETAADILKIDLSRNVSTTRKKEAWSEAAETVEY